MEGIYCVGCFNCIKVLLAIYVLNFCGTSSILLYPCLKVREFIVKNLVTYPLQDAAINPKFRGLFVTFLATDMFICMSLLCERADAAHAVVKIHRTRPTSRPSACGFNMLLRQEASVKPNSLYL